MIIDRGYRQLESLAPTGVQIIKQSLKSADPSSMRKILLASLACATALAAPTAAHAEDPPLVNWSDLLPGLTTG
jgi:hypothetical protein